MNYKKVIASILCVAFAAGFTGCDNTEKDREAISKVIDDCADAFRDDDAEAFLELTCWDEDDKDYRQIEEYMNYSVDEDYRECYDLIFDTIEIDYDVDDIEVNGDKASVKVKYEIIDLSEVDFKVANLNLTFMDAVKDTKETSSIKAKIDFELEKGEWKIKKITNLDKLFAFVVMINPPEYVPTPPPDPTETQTTVPDPTETQPANTEPSDSSTATDFPDSYVKAMASFRTVLEQNKDAIQLTESIFGINTVGFYDFDGNGIPEMYFFSNDSGDYAASLHIYEYGEYSGEAMEVVTFDEIITQGQAGNFVIFATDKELVITNTFGETYKLSVYTNVYTLENTSDGFYKWDLTGNYSRYILTDYDPETDTETTTYTYCESGLDVTEDHYMKAVKDLVARAVITLGRMYTFTSNDPEYKLISLPSNRTMGYGLAIEYVDSGI